MVPRNDEIDDGIIEVVLRIGSLRMTRSPSGWSVCENLLSQKDKLTYGIRFHGEFRRAMPRFERALALLVAE